MAEYIDHTGDKIGDWTIIKRADPRPRHTFWVCKCKCGNICEVEGSNLRRGKSKQCKSCYQSKRKGKTFTIKKVPSNVPPKEKVSETMYVKKDIFLSKKKIEKKKGFFAKLKGLVG